MAFDIRRGGFNSRESAKLNAVLGKRVKITLFNGRVIIGVLEKNLFNTRPYSVLTENGHYSFYKTHVKKIEEAAGNGRN